VAEEVERLEVFSWIWIAGYARKCCDFAVCRGVGYYVVKRLKVYCAVLFNYIPEFTVTVEVALGLVGERLIFIYT